MHVSGELKRHEWQEHSTYGTHRAQRFVHGEMLSSFSRASWPKRKVKVNFERNIAEVHGKQTTNNLEI